MSSRQAIIICRCSTRRRIRATISAGYRLRWERHTEFVSWFHASAGDDIASVDAATIEIPPTAIAAVPVRYSKVCRASGWSPFTCGWPAMMRANAKPATANG